MDDHSQRTVSDEEFAADVPGLLQRAAAGETVTITSHGEPVAQLVPAPRTDRRAERDRRRALIDEMERQREAEGRPFLHLGKFNRDWAYED